MKFAVFTHAEHFQKDGRIYAYAPYVREMDLWFSHVDSVEVLAPLTKEKDFPARPYQDEKLQFTSLEAINLLSFRNVFSALYRTPGILWRIFGAMKRADHLHLRCPGNIGLMACLVQMFFPSKPKTVKYAGNWDPKSRQPLSYRLQKWILNNTFLSKNIKVLAYGEWPGQSKNILPFFTASFSENDKICPEKNFSDPFKFLFVGNLVEGKRPLFAVKLIEKLNEAGIVAELSIYGSGSEEERLKSYISRNSLEGRIFLKGKKDLEELKKAYQESDLVILPSKSEGWPKVLAEGMFYGCVPVATPVSCVPWMLDREKRGILIEPHLEPAISKIKTELADVERLRKRSKEACEWSQIFTVEKFESAIKELL